jgi:hypothetical protein
MRISAMLNEEKDRMKYLARELDHLWVLEEIRARLGARDRNILERDRNTTYFHVVVNHGCRKKRIESLKGPDGMVHDTHGILKIPVEYYKELFSWESRGSVRLAEDFWGPEEKLPPAERLELEAPFLVEEVKKVVFSSYPEGAPGPDDLSFLFY